MFVFVTGACIVMAIAGFYFFREDWIAETEAASPLLERKAITRDGSDDSTTENSSSPVTIVTPDHNSAARNNANSIVTVIDPREGSNSASPAVQERSASNSSTRLRDQMVGGAATSEPAVGTPVSDANAAVGQNRRSITPADRSANADISPPIPGGAVNSARRSSFTLEDEEYRARYGWGAFSSAQAASMNEASP